VRLLFVSWRDLVHDQAGGAEVVVDRLASGMQARGHDTALLCGGPVGTYSYPVVRAGGTFSQYLRAPLHYARRFRDVDLLVDCENGIPYFSPLWRRGPSVCLVHHVHTDQWRDRFGRTASFVGRSLEEHAMPRVYRHQLFATISPSSRRALVDVGVCPDRIRLLPSGVDLLPILPKDPEPLFLCLGRLVPHKRVQLVFEAWNQVRPVVGGRLLVVGDGPERAVLERRAPPGVVFAGRLPEQEKQRLLSTAWLLVQASHHEGWGLVIMEAAAGGTPTLAYDAPGVRDAVAHGLSGFVVASPEQFAERWTAIATQPQLRAGLSRGALERAKSFPWARTLDIFESIATEAIRTCRRQR
jgi:glycosyltransferase involved in cell wall biosynthesis